MLLGDFIKELKHNSLNIIITDDEEVLFNGTLSTLKNNIHYQTKWNICRIYTIDTFYNENMKTALEIDIITKEINK